MGIGLVCAYWHLSVERFDELWRARRESAAIGAASDGVLHLEEKVGVLVGE